MKFKKSMLILIMAVFLISIAGAYASDAEMASEDANHIELSSDNEMTEDNLQTSEENEILAQANDDETVCVETDSQTLTAGEGNYSDLREDIGNGGNLTKSHYVYHNDDGDTIEIKTPGMVINGNGAVIDMNGSAVQAFKVSASGVTIKDLTIRNANYNGDGGAIYFTSSGTVINCNFTDNTASHGGAVHFKYGQTGTVKNCNFVHNNASVEGGAVWIYSGIVKNCNFTNNTSCDAGAIWINSGTVENCNFTDNFADSSGGAILLSDDGNVTGCNFINNKVADNSGGATYFSSFGAVENCNFNNNSANQNGGAVFFNRNGTVTYSNFTDNTADCEDGGAIYFGSNGKVIGCNFANSHASSDGGAVFFSNYAISAVVENCNFTVSSASSGGAIFFDCNGTVKDCNFNNNRAYRDGGAICFSEDAYSSTVGNCNFVNNNAWEGGAICIIGPLGIECWSIVENCNFTNNTADNGGAVKFQNTRGNVTNCNFTNNNATGMSSNGGAVYFHVGGEVTNCSFVNNSVNGNGGAVHFYLEGTVTNCNFTNNKATRANYGYGGAVYFYVGAIVTDCNFADNTAAKGSAIYCTGNAIPDVSNSVFLNNRADALSLDVTANENNIEITFRGCNNFFNAIYSGSDITFTNITYWAANGITNSGNVTVLPSRSDREAGQNITIVGFVNGSLLNTSKITDDDGRIVLKNVTRDYYIWVRHNSDSYYTETEKRATNMQFQVNVTGMNATNRTVNLTAKSNIYNEIMPGKLQFVLENDTKINATYTADGIWWAVHTFDDYGIHIVNASYIGLNDVEINTALVTLIKANSILKQDIVCDYGNPINITVAAEGAVGIIVKINGGQVSADNFTVPISDLDVGNYTLTVTTIPDGEHSSITMIFNIRVNKVDSTLMVSNIAFDYKATGSGEISFTGATGVNASVIDQPNAIVNVSNNTIMVSGLDAGTYTLMVTTMADANHNPVTRNATITVNKLKTQLAASAVTTVYNVNRNLVITLKDAGGNPLTGVKVAVDLNGANEYVTDKNGQIKVVTKGLAAGTYAAKITFNGDANHGESTKDVKVTVKKATPNITAKKKTFKAKTKNKKYAVTLKDNTGKAMNKVQLTIKIGKKTYKATTNAKGKATFKIKKLTKKGKYNAVVTYKGDKYYNKVTKKVKITIK